MIEGTGFMNRVINYIPSIELLVITVVSIVHFYKRYSKPTYIIILPRERYVEILESTYL